MTFEEFFNKKRIDLTALQAGEPALFAEFQNHYEQMGEKSFDHTKKYWFNKLRLQYHLAPGQKPEKVHLENQLAEQTITESLTEAVPAAAPKVGFKPRFNAGAVKPKEQGSDVKNPAIANSATATPEVNKATATADQTPAFQQEKEAMQAAADAAPRTTDDGESPKQVTKPGFKPRFNMKMAQGNAPQTKQTEPQEEETAAQAETPAAPAETAAPKPAAFKPRFNMKMVTPKPAEEDAKTEIAEPDAEKPAKPVIEDTDKPENTPSESVPKPVGFKPRFNAAKIKPKPPQE